MGKIRHQEGDCLQKCDISSRDDSVKQLRYFLVNTTKEIHIRWSSVKSFVFYQELSKNHFWLFSLFYYRELHWIWPLLLDNIHYHSELLRIRISHFRQQCHICVDVCKRWHIKYSLDRFGRATHSQPQECVQTVGQEEDAFFWEARLGAAHSSRQRCALHV